MVKVNQIGWLIYFSKAGSSDWHKFESSTKNNDMSLRNNFFCSKINVQFEIFLKLENFWTVKKKTQAQWRNFWKVKKKNQAQWRPFFVQFFVNYSTVLHALALLKV